MASTLAPVLKHREWRFLLRELIAAHPRMRPVASEGLRHLLTPAASVAWWMLKFAPELLDQESLHVLIPGAGKPECDDDGRWFAFLPWLLGLPSLRTHVTLVGDQLASDETHGPASSSGKSTLELRRNWRTPIHGLVECYPEATIFNGTIGAWRQGPGKGVHPDACILFSPGFTSHYKTWFTEDDLLPLLRAQKLPLGMFFYSHMDGLEDLEALRRAGVEYSAPALEQNPWRTVHEMSEYIGGFGQMGCRLQVIAMPAAPNIPAVEEFCEVLDYAKPDFRELGADQALERLGARWPVKGPSGKEDAIVVLPQEHGFLESSGALGEFNDKGFSPFDPPIIVPEEHRVARPPQERTLDRILWAILLHRDWVSPALESQAEEEIRGLSMDDLRDGMRDLIKRALGRDDLDPDDVMDQMRASGIAHGPTHPAWYDLLANLEWKLKDYEEEPERLTPGFWTRSVARRVDIPVICEAYALNPSDDSDELAQEAMDLVAEDYPKGALLLFKGMPYKEVAGHKYHFGGMLWWGGAWQQFALTPDMKSFDDVIDQIESGFSFDSVDQKYADDTCGITVALNRMCFGCDPNGDIPMMGLTSRGWTTLMPDG